jgi:hypothetical protein
VAFNSRLGKATLELSINGGAFVRGAGDAKATMRDLSRSIAATQRDIGRQAFQLSGRDQIAEAGKLTEAIARVGGASKLTAAEKARVNAQLQQAIEKYRVLGKQAPAAMIATERATRSAGTATDWMNGKVVALGAAVGTFGASVALGAARGLLSLARNAIASSGRLVDLAASTGLSIRALQTMELIGKKSGITVDAFADSVYKLGVNVNGGGDSVTAALGELGLSLERLQQLRPEQQFLTIMGALAKVRDETERNRIGNELFGRQFKAIARSVGEDWEKIAHSARFASDAQVRAIDAAQDAWDNFLAHLEARSQRAGGNIVLAFQQLQKLGLRDLLTIAAVSEGTPTGFIKNLAQVAQNAATREAARASLAEQKRRSLEQATKTEADYVKQLQAASAELGKLDANERKQIAAAQALGTDTDVVTSMLVRFGVSAVNADAALRLLNGSTKTSAKTANEAGREWQQLLDRWNDVDRFKDAFGLSRGINTGAINFNKPEEQLRSMLKALLDSKPAWQFWSAAAVAEIKKATAALQTSKQMLESYRLELMALERPDPNAAVPMIDESIAQANTERELEGQDPKAAARTRLDAEKQFKADMRDLTIAQAEFDIKQAERAGVSRVRILQMEGAVAQRKYDAEVADAKRAFEQQTRDLQRGTEEGKAEYDKRELEHRAYVRKLNEQNRQAIEEREADIRRESSFWASELGKRIKGELRGIAHEATGRLFSTLFARGDAEAKKRAKEAREDYERIKNSGKASAEEITRAFRNMRQAEEAAQSKWADRFKGVWDNIKRHIFNIFDALLEKFVNGLLQGMLSALAKSAIGKRLMAFIDKLIPGPSIFGTAAPVAAATTAPLLASSSIPLATASSTAAAPAIASQGASAAVYGAEGTAAAGTATGTGTTAAGGGMASNLATAAPYAYLGLAAYWAFRPPKAWQINEDLARFLKERGGQPGHSHYDHRMFSAEYAKWKTDNPTQWDAWRQGKISLPKFHTGGLIDEHSESSRRWPHERMQPGEIIIKALKGEGVLTPRAVAAIGGKAVLDALNAGGSLPQGLLAKVRESQAVSPWQGLHRRLDLAMTPPDIANPANWLKPSVVTPRANGDAAPAARPSTVNITIQALDGADVERVVRQKIAPKLQWMMRTNQDGLASQVRKTALT